MSETFYIKKTAFDDNNFDLATREADSFIIGPGELNGPGGLARDSDLELYGFGSLKWGEGVNQNQYRQLESNSCPAKVDGDYLAGGADGNTDFLVGTHGIVPKSEEDLGIGNGITAPLFGQLWYNTTDEILYNYELSGWETVFKEVTDALNSHAADTTLHLSSDQNIFLDGLTLGSPLLTSDDVNRLIGMSSISGVTTVQGQLDLMVLRTGDIMTGDLTINTANAQLILLPTAAGQTPQFAIHDDSATERAIFIFTDATDDVQIIRNNNAGAAESTLTLESDGNVSLTGGAEIPTADAHLTRRDFITDNYAPLVSPPLTGTPTSTTPATSDNSTRIATTAYVQAQVDNAGSGTHTGSSGSELVPAGVTMVEFLIIGGGGGGAGGGDGGNFTGHAGQVGGTTSITIPGYGTVSALGGVGGRGTQGATITQNNKRRGGVGISNPGAHGEGGNPGRGGNGGGSLAGRGGTGSTVGAQGQSGTFGGGGAGGWGQDNASGEGGSSGNQHQFMVSVTPGTTITWTVGSGGAGGTYTGSTRRGGTGGAGYILLRFMNWS